MRISDWSSDVCSSDLQHEIDLVVGDLGMMATRRRDAAARRKLTIPADFLDIGAGQLGDVAAGLVMARAFGDDAGGRRDAVFPIEREAVAVANLAGADPGCGEALEPSQIGRAAWGERGG